MYLFLSLSSSQFSNSNTKTLKTPHIRRRIILISLNVLWLKKISKGQDKYEEKKKDMHETGGGGGGGTMSADLKDYTIIKEGEAEILMRKNEVFYNPSQVP